MSLSTEISSAAAEAQSVLAELGGARPGKKNSLYNGTPLLAVYGQPQVEKVPLPTGGYKQRVFLPLTVTRAQFGAPPVSGKQWTRTDLTPHVTYTTHAIGTHDSVLFHVMLFKAGE